MSHQPKRIAKRTTRKAKRRRSGVIGTSESFRSSIVCVPTDDESTLQETCEVENKSNASGTANAGGSDNPGRPALRRSPRLAKRTAKRQYAVRRRARRTLIKSDDVPDHAPPITPTKSSNPRNDDGDGGGDEDIASTREDTGDGDIASTNEITGDGGENSQRKRTSSRRRRCSMPSPKISLPSMDGEEEKGTEPPVPMSPRTLRYLRRQSLSAASAPATKRRRNVDAQSKMDRSTTQSEEPEDVLPPSSPPKVDAKDSSPSEQSLDDSIVYQGEDVDNVEENAVLDGEDDVALNIDGAMDDTDGRMSDTPTRPKILPRDDDDDDDDDDDNDDVNDDGDNGDGDNDDDVVVDDDAAVHDESHDDGTRRSDGDNIDDGEASSSTSLHDAPLTKPFGVGQSTADVQERGNPSSSPHASPCASPHGDDSSTSKSRRRASLPSSSTTSTQSASSGPKRGSTRRKRASLTPRGAKRRSTRGRDRNTEPFLANLNTKLCPLPKQMDLLYDRFQALDVVCQYFLNRGSITTFETMREAVENYCRHAFNVRHLAQIKTVWPGGFHFDLRSTHNDYTDRVDYHLLVLPNYARPSPTRPLQHTRVPLRARCSSGGDGGGDKASMEHLTQHAAQRCSNASPMQLVRRRAAFKARLYQRVIFHHDSFLHQLRARGANDVRAAYDDYRKHGWHPEFPVAHLPRIPEAFLPQPPTRLVLETPSKKRKGSPMPSRCHTEAHVARHSLKKRLFMRGSHSAIKRAANATPPHHEEATDGPSPIERMLRLESANLAQRLDAAFHHQEDEPGSVSIASSTTSSSTTTTTKENQHNRKPSANRTHSARKQTRHASKDRAKMRMAAASLPRLCDILRSCYHSNRRTCMPLTTLVGKVLNSISAGSSRLTKEDLLERLQMLEDAAPTWCTIFHLDDEMYVRVNTRTCNFNEVRKQVTRYSLCAGAQ